MKQADPTLCFVCKKPHADCRCAGFDHYRAKRQDGDLPDEEWQRWYYEAKHCLDIWRDG